MPLEEKPTPAVELARELFKEYYASCFWHLKPDLVITEAMIPVVIKGVRANGGRQGFLAAAKLMEQAEK
jgi:hypothetical protein